MALGRKNKQGKMVASLKSRAANKLQNRNYEVNLSNLLERRNMSLRDLVERYGLLSFNELNAFLYRKFKSTPATMQEARNIFPEVNAILAKEEGLKYEEAVENMEYSEHIIKKQVSESLKVILKAQKEDDSPKEDLQFIEHGDLNLQPDPELENPTKVDEPPGSMAISEPSPADFAKAPANLKNESSGSVSDAAPATVDLEVDKESTSLKKEEEEEDSSKKTRRRKRTYTRRKKTKYSEKDAEV